MATRYEGISVHPFKGHAQVETTTGPDTKRLGRGSDAKITPKTLKKIML